MDKIVETGQVVYVENGYVTVRMERKQACVKCQGCVSGITATEMHIKAKNLCRAAVNDTVKLEMHGERFLQAVSIAYGIPLIFLLTGFVGGYHAWNIWIMEAGREIAGFVSGLSLMVVSYFLMKINEKNMDTEKYMPRATETVKV